MRIVVSVLEEVDVSVRDVAPASSSTLPNPASSTGEQDPHRRDGGVLTYCGDQLVPMSSFGATHAICSRCGQTMKAVWG